MANYPHCDQDVLHEKGICQYCDKFPKKQQYRIDNKISFTGTHAPGCTPCPSDAKRGIGGAHKWPGNVPREKDCSCTLFEDPECLIHGDNN